VFTDRSHLWKTVSTSQTTNDVLSELNCMMFSKLLNCMNVVCGSTCRECFPKMAPVCIHKVNCF